MTQVAPYPDELEDLVREASYRPNWVFDLVDLDRGQGCEGLTLQILVVAVDSLDFNRTIRVQHLFPVPAAAYNRDSWMRWLLDRVLDVEQHEACEFFRINGERVFAPHHSEGEDPYIIWQVGDLATARKTFRDK